MAGVTRNSTKQEGVVDEEEGDVLAFVNNLLIECWQQTICNSDWRAINQGWRVDNNSILFSILRICYPIP